MGFHTFDPESADRLEDESRYRFCSREELVAALDLGAGGGEREAAVADFGSGTGFYTDDVAPFAGELRAVDVQEEMHETYREKGVPENVELVTADIDDLPFGDAELDAAFSTMTFHEFAGSGTDDGAGAEVEVARVLRDGGRFVVVDWSANGSGDGGPPVEERYSRDEAVELLEDAGFDVVRADERPETFLVIAER
ncbi:class I SAM-dependent methyltransferase [Halorussus ruber]|uniref:class I SAM-dependent methyltransferase n=1 Tax=Halorussus ruber TaxID=1126238 RepID=UPI001091937D|nr:class I SAM-dependent methyltransferase [Halorussus ruber]